MRKKSIPYKISPELKKKALDLWTSGSMSRGEIVKMIEREAGVSDRGARYAFRRIADKAGPVQESASNKGNEGELEFEKDYVYNSLTDDYVFFTYKLLGKPITLKKEKVDSMLKRYSRFDGDESTVNEIASSFALSRPTVIFILRALGITHDSLPATSEDIMTREPDELAESVLAERMFVFNREYEKKAWKKVNEEARNWRKFVMRELNPYERFVEGFSYRHKPFKINPKATTREDYAFMAGCSDIHLGAYAKRRDLYHGKDWNMDIAVEAYKSYVDQLFSEVQNRKQRPDVLYLLVLGDISHSLKGKTYKDTPLENVEVDEEPQIDAGFCCLDYHIQAGLEIGFKRIRVKLVRGNHNPLGDWAIGRFVQIAYEKDERVDVEVATERWLAFKFSRSLFVMEHGASPYYKSLVPKGGSERESYVQRIFLARPELLQGIDHRYFLTADQHNLEYSDSKGFEFIRFGTAVRGDKYADHHNLHSRPKQNVLEVTDKGIASIINIYLD